MYNVLFIITTGKVHTSQFVVPFTSSALAINAIRSFNGRVRDTPYVQYQAIPLFLGENK